MIIQSYNKNFSGGLGDFLRGAIFIYRNYKKDFFVDFKHHPISSWLENNNESEEEYEENEIINLDVSVNKNEIKNKIEKILVENKKQYVSSNYFNLNNNEKEITLSEKEKFFFRNCFGFNKVKKEYNLLLEKHKLEDYKVVHFRLGDIELLKKEPEEIKKNILNQKLYSYEYLYDLISPKKKLYEYLYFKLIKNRKIILLSDSNDFKKFVIRKNNKNIIVPNTKSNHTVYRPGRLKICQKNKIKIENMMDLVLDINIMAKAKNVESYSAYRWGSGFSFWICKIFDIPLDFFLI